MTSILTSEADSRLRHAVQGLLAARNMSSGLAESELDFPTGATLVVTDLAPALMAGAAVASGLGADRLARIEALIAAAAAGGGRIVLVSGPQTPSGAATVDADARRIEMALANLPGGRSVILRACDVMDPQDPGLRTALRPLIEGRPTARWPVADVVQIIALDDLATAVVAATQTRGIDGRAFDIVHPEAQSRFAIQAEAQRIARLLVDPDLTDTPARPAYPPATGWRDATPATDALHVRPQIPVFVLLAQTVQGMVADSIRQRAIAPISAPMPAVHHALETGDLPLAGRCAVVTGATGQLGRATARMLLRLGADVIGVARRAAAGDEMERAFAAERGFLSRQRRRLDADRVRRDGGPPVAGEPGQFRFVQGDLADTAALKSVAARLSSELPQIHILIHAAGGIRRDRQETSQKIEAVLALHMLAPLALTRLLSGPLSRSGGAWVINPVTVSQQFYPYDLADLHSHNAYEPHEVLARAHSGLVALTGAMGQAMVGTGVNIAAVALPKLRTPLLVRLEGAMTGGVVEQHMEKTKRAELRSQMETPARGAAHLLEVMLAQRFAQAHGCLVVDGDIAGPILRPDTDFNRLNALWATSAALSGLPE